MFVLVGCGGRDFQRSSTASSVAPATLAITPPSHSSTNPEDVQLAAAATYADGTTADVTSRVTWSATPGYFGGTATVSASGLLHWSATAGYRDSTTVTATLSGVTSDGATVYYSQY